MANRWGNSGNSDRLYFLGLQNHHSYCSHEIKRRLLPGRKVDQPRQLIKKQRYYFASKGPSSQSYGFSSSYVWTWELDYKESWVPKNWCFWTVVLEKTLESPLDGKEIQPVQPKRNQSWTFIERTDAEAETPILWPPDARTDSLEKILMLGKIEGGRRRGRQSMRWLMASATQWTWVWVTTPGVGDGQGGLVCCSPWGRKESDTTKRLSLTKTLL